MRSPVCGMFGIETPIFAFSHCRDVVVAVSRAGGFGVLGTAHFSPEELERELSWIDAHIDGRPYGLDLLMPSSYAKVDQATPDLSTLIPEGHRAFMAALLERNGVPALPEGMAEEIRRVTLRRFSVSPEQHAEELEIAFRHPFKLLVAALGRPNESVVRRARENGVKLAALVGTPEHAARQREAGMDLVIAQGTEAAGHTGTISTMVLTPQVVDLMAPTPVLAAGGIATGRQMAAAMALGAAGVWCGSVWLCTAESDAPPEVKRRILAAQSKDAVITRSYSGKPSRVLRSGWTDAWAAAGAPDPLQMPLQSLLTKEAMARVTRAGADAMASYPAGQVIGQMRSETSVRQVFQDMLTEFAETMERLNGTVG